MSSQFNAHSSANIRESLIPHHFPRTLFNLPRFGLTSSFPVIARFILERPESHTIHFNEIPKDAEAVDVGSKQVTIVKHLDDDNEVFLLKISGCFFMQKQISTEYKL